MIETVPQRVARAALQLDETGVNGAHFTLKLANSGMMSVGYVRFKSPSRTSTTGESLNVSQELLGGDGASRGSS